MAFWRQFEECQNAYLSRVQEIGARVWYALVDNGGRLQRKYNPRWGTSL